MNFVCSAKYTFDHCVNTCSISQTTSEKMRHVFHIGKLPSVLLWRIIANRHRDTKHQPKRSSTVRVREKTNQQPQQQQRTCQRLMWTIAHYKLCYGLGFLSSNYTLIYFIYIKCQNGWLDSRKRHQHWRRKKNATPFVWVSYDRSLFLFVLFKSLSSLFEPLCFCSCTRAQLNVREII